MMDLKLSGKRVLVTGASRGIGAAIAQRFLDEGADVLIVSRGSEQLFLLKDKLQGLYGKKRIFAEKCDCTSMKSLRMLQDTILHKWAGVDVVVANVGDGRSVSDPLPDEEHWERTWKNNFDSALYTARVFLPALEVSHGSLLFISSITGLEAFGAPVDYSTAKSGVTALAKNVARKLARKVRVNVLAPGNVIFSGSSWDLKVKQDPERVSKILAESVPMNRFGLPEEIADAAVFLCSERAAFITGSVLVVDGGQTVGVF